MAKFGYSISRTSSSQAGEGRAVSTSNLRAGDLVFYGNGGSINHVAVYIGGGQVYMQVIPHHIQEEGLRFQM